MPLVVMKDLLQHAYQHGYAVGAFGVVGWDILEGVVEAAERARAPFILSVSKQCTGTDKIESLARAVVEVGRRAAAPVAVQVEVGNDLQAAEAALAMGCGGIVFNGSACSLLDNIARTKRVVTLAAPHKVLVIGQLGQLEGEGGDGESGNVISPLESRIYVERTGIGCLAVSVSRVGAGSKCDFTRLQKISQAVEIPLGVHGSTGFTDERMRRLIGFGATKINYSSPLLDLAAHRIRENALAGSQGYAATMNGVREAVRNEVERCIKVWGSGGRAAEVLLQCPRQDRSESGPVDNLTATCADLKSAAPI